MSTDDLHAHANQSTPQGVEIPKTYTGLLVWAIGKWGVGVVFLALLVPVYQDLKSSNQRLADISVANVEVLRALAARVDAATERVGRIDDAVRRLEAHRPTTP